MSQSSGIEVGQVIGHMKKKGSFRVVTVGFVLGLVLLILGSVFFKDGKSSETTEAARISFSVQAYKQELMQEIESICLKVEQVKSVKVIVFFDEIGGSVYAQNVQDGGTYKSEYVIVGSGSGSHALYLGESLPELSGVGIVCDTGDSARIRSELSMLISSVYGLPLTRVYVSEG
jgi:hypothetical protein